MVVVPGGAGDTVADFSGRSLALVLKNNGTADDGETTPTAEVVNIGTDIKKLVGGYGNDVITGGSGDEIFVGGAGNDTITGGMGNDTMDYSGSPAGVTVTLCFTAPAAVSGVVPPGGGCAAGANDGVTAGAWTETDDVYQVEHVIGSPFNDILGDMATSATLAVELTIEGGAGDDIIWGGTVNDTLWGDSGNDTLHGGDGDDNLSGDAGDDALDGGASSGDICLSDAADVTTAQVECESI
jgi:Ca2+-binding RTX toxin-like protein